MRIFFDERQLAHAPEKELHDSAFEPHAEHPGRARNVVAALGTVEAPADHGDVAIRAVHCPDYLAFLGTAWSEWRASGRSGDAMGYVWPIACRRPLPLDRIDAKFGRYSFDATTPITEASWESAYWAAQCALSALDAVRGGDPAAFALCRPPGHHAGRDYLGGYCYLNNAAIAAQGALASGAKRIAILDVDYHHGNGSQDIFWQRGDVLFVSIHADPRTDYPFFWGHANETGDGEGIGATINLPLPRGTAWRDYEAALDDALARIATFAPDMMVVSYGADTFAGDPISCFALETSDYPAMGQRIAGLGIPAVIVMEGGYAVDALGANVAAFLEGFA